MNKKKLTITFLSVVCSTFISFSQSSTLSSTQPNKSETNELTSLKPLNAQGATFSSKEEMETALPSKIANIKAMISSGKYDDNQVKVLREDLWRFENAFVLEK